MTELQRSMQSALTFTIVDYGAILAEYAMSVWGLQFVASYFKGLMIHIMAASVIWYSLPLESIIFGGFGLQS